MMVMVPWALESQLSELNCCAQASLAQKKKRIILVDKHAHLRSRKTPNFRIFFWNNLPKNCQPQSIWNEFTVKCLTRILILILLIGLIIPKNAHVNTPAFPFDG
jgi:hypothetical protein